jgi:hypothetical protein
MRGLKNSFFYLFIIGGFSLLMYWILLHGKLLEAGRPIVTTTSGAGHWNDFIQSMQHNFEHPLSILLVQIITIILVARFFGWVCRKIGQPSVIGEIIAGILLGPSLIGMYYPDGGTSGEFAVRWTRLGGKVVPRLEAFDDSWSALAHFGDLLEWMATVDDQCVGPKEFTEKLREFGIRDKTKRVEGE